MTKDDTFTDQFRTGNETLTGLVLYKILMPTQLWFVAQVADALLSMTKEYNWQQSGSVTIDDAVNAATDMLGSFAPMIGTILCITWASIPETFLLCDGTTYDKADYPELYDVLDSVFIVDADHFKTPDLRNAVPVGAGDIFSVGDIGGEMTHTLNTSEMPSHGHTDTGHLHALNGEFPGLALAPGELPVDVPGSGEFTALASANITNTGGGGTHNNMQPYIALKYVIWAA